MKYGISPHIYGSFYHMVCKKKLDKKTAKAVKAEYKAIIGRAKDIGNSRLLNSYCMCAYFIALCRCNKTDPQQNCDILWDGLYHSKLFRSMMGNADSYLDPKKMPGRLKWSEESHKRTYENDWVVDILPGNGEYELGYNYLECGDCKMCRDEGCPELAHYLCQMDFNIADLMGLDLKRTQILADGCSCCDFRYSHKK